MPSLRLVDSVNSESASRGGLRRLVSQISIYHECTCSCHACGPEDDNGLRVQHITPCCSRCPWCTMNIAGDLDAHIRNDHPECVGVDFPSKDLLDIPVQSED